MSEIKLLNYNYRQGNVLFQLCPLKENSKIPSKQIWRRFLDFDF